MKISGYTVVRNAIELDYCIRETILSLLPVCDEVIVCDSDSTDGTLDLVRSIDDPKIRIINWPWPNPVDDKLWLVEWINFTRQHCTGDMQLQLDADEVLHEDSYYQIHIAARRRLCRWFHRLNFWGDLRYLAPKGYVCGDAVARLGPVELPMPSDEPYPNGDEPLIRTQAGWHPNLAIHHYGFLRKTDAFYRKSRVVQTAFFGNMDERLKRCEQTGENWVQACPFPVPLQLYKGTQPEVARQWLKERGYE